MFTTDPFRKIKIKIYLLQIYKNPFSESDILRKTSISGLMFLNVSFLGESMF